MQVNPVVVKELRGRMRGWRAAITLTIYLVVLGGIMLLFYAMLRSTSTAGGPQAAQVGKFLFSAIVLFQAILVSLLTPGFTAGAITAEKEQKTYDLLMTTLLPARSVIFGKLGSALAYVVLLILAAAPLESLSFMFGGVSPEEIILSQVTLFFAAVLFASVGIFWSTIVRTSAVSNVLTYGTILFQMIGIPILYFTVTSAMGAFNSPNGITPPLAETPPFWYASGIVLSLNPLAAMIISESFWVRGDPLFIYTTNTLLNGHTLLVVSPWLIFCMEALIFSALLVALSIRLVRPIRHGSESPARASRQGEPSAERREPSPVGPEPVSVQEPPESC